MCLFLWYRKFCYSARVSLLFAMNRVVLRIQIIEMQSCFFSGEILLQIRSDEFFYVIYPSAIYCHLVLFWLVKLFLLGKTEGRNTLLIGSQNSTYWLHKFHMCHNIYLYKWVNRNTFTCSLESRAVAHLAFSVFIQIWVISFWFNFIDLNSLFIIFTNCYQKVQFLPYKAIWQSLPFNAYFITSLILTGLSFQRCQQGVLFNLRTSSL